MTAPPPPPAPSLVDAPGAPNRSLHPVLMLVLSIPAGLLAAWLTQKLILGTGCRPNCNDAAYEGLGTDLLSLVGALAAYEIAGLTLIAVVQRRHRVWAPLVIHALLPLAALVALIAYISTLS